MVAVVIFMVALFTAMGGAAALADTRFRRLRCRSGPGPYRSGFDSRPDNRPLQSGGGDDDEFNDDARVLLAEIEDWLKQRHYR